MQFPIPSYGRLLVQFSLSTWECLTLTLSLGMIPCEYPDKVYLAGNKNDMSYLTLKTTGSYLHSSGQNTGTWRTVRQTELVYLLQRSA